MENLNKLTQQDIESMGFELQFKSIDKWYKYKESPILYTTIQDFYGYKPYNLYLNHGEHDNRLKIKCDFSGGLDFDKSDCLFEGECKTLDDLKIILKYTHINN